MTDKTKDSQDDILISYVKQLEEDNKRLKTDLKIKAKPSFDFTSITRLLRDISDHGLAQTIFVLSIIGLAVLGIYKISSFHGPNGQYYVQRYGHYTTTTTPECECPSAKTNRYTCYIVRESITLGEDRAVTDCFNRDDAFKTAEEFTEKWKMLKNKGK